MANYLFLVLFEESLVSVFTGLLYQIVLCGWGNTQSGIRREVEKNDVIVVPTSYLDDSQFVDFWITWDVDTADNNKRWIRVGTGHTYYANEFMSATVDKYDVNYVGVGTGWSNKEGADWRLYY